MERRPPRRTLLRVTVDTNLFVSATISRGSPLQLILAWRRGLFVLVLSESLVREVGTVLRRPHIVERYGVRESDVRRLERRFERAAAIVADDELSDLPAELQVRDVKDVRILQTALTGEADFLVSGDDDLLSLSGEEALGKLQVITVNDFLARLERHNSVQVD